ncbi:MAG: hypothetical protein B7X83_02045 [Polynucleobacter sp. 17-46-58]|nr:MAG: hypothetical protein B7X83_02045 [Polynucleobacter sp. 17-46-58]
MWCWVLFEIISGLVFFEASFFFKTAYFLVTSIPIWLYFAFVFISQLMDRVTQLERKVTEMQLKK